MELDSLLRLNRIIRVIGFDDAPFVAVAGKIMSKWGGEMAELRYGHFKYHWFSR